MGLEHPKWRIKMSVWNRKCEKLDKRKINKNNLKKVMNNMMKIKKENKKKSRSVFYDGVVLNNSPSYEKDFSFLSTKKKPIRNSNKRFMNEQKSDFWKEVDEIIRELESDC